eukprot:UN22505
MECIRKSQEKDQTRMASVILLTDGQPNKRPPRGEVVMMQKHMDKYPGLHFSMNTIGFGYNLDSPLLIDLAKAGHGTYAFIPDSGLVGTVFVNLTSNLLTTMSPNVTISLEPDNDAKIVKVEGAYSSSMEDWGCQVSLGALTYERSRGVVVHMECPKGTDDIYLNVTVEYQIRGGSSNTKRLEATLSGSQGTQQEEIVTERFRLKTAAMVLESVASISTQS